MPRPHAPAGLPTPTTLGRVTPPAIVLDDRALLDIPEVTALALPVWPAEAETGPLVGAGGAEIAEFFGFDPLELLERESATGRTGEIVAVPVIRRNSTVQKVLLVGMGDGSPTSCRRAGAALVRRLKERDTLATTLATNSDDEALRALAEGLVLASYGFKRKSSTSRDQPDGAARQTVVLADISTERGAALERGLQVAHAAWLARDLIHTPSNEKDPAWLAAQAERIAAERGLGVKVWDEHALRKAGFGGILGVGMGSVRPPRLVQLTYEPPAPYGPTPHVVLVGKGITYDTGGLSLKPRESMIPMKTDMSGGGVVIAVMSALRDLGCRVRVTGLVAAAENMPSGSAQRPGDILRQYDGTTVEVRNTDAEGRLVLADAMGYAVTDLQPDLLVDIATLTGAATLGLGKRHAALYATEDSLAADLVAAGEAAGERLWRMPLVDDYRFALDSAVADLSHIETERVHGGSITAALFLQRFASDVTWAHLDIAGPGRADADEHEVTKGGTGFGTRTLLRWLESLPVPEA